MKFEIIPTPDFEKSFKALAKKHRSLKQDIVEFTESLKANPFQGMSLPRESVRFAWLSRQKAEENPAVQG